MVTDIRFRVVKIFGQNNFIFVALVKQDQIIYSMCNFQLVI